MDGYVKLCEELFSAAKTEFKHYLAGHAPKVDAKISAVETLDHPTDAELLAQARKYFHADDRMHPQRA